MAPDIQNLGSCIEDARRAGLDQDPGLADPLQFHAMRGRLQTAQPRIPQKYLDIAFTPFVTKLDRLGEQRFNQILLSDPNRERAAGLMLDIAQTMLQRGEGIELKAIAAFQEVVSDLYDGFLSVEDRQGIAPPDLEVVAPLAKFGNPEFGPYTWPADATRNFDVQVGVVNRPPANAHLGLLAWPALAHETAGHDVLNADNGLLQQTSSAVRQALLADPTTQPVADYWAARIDETASDVLGILNMGPAPAIGLIGFFRGLNAAFGQGPKLRNNGPASDPHPADIVRGFLAAATVRQLEFSGATAWADLIDAETTKDVHQIVLAGRKVNVKVAKHSAEIVSQVIVTHPMPSLEHHAFGQIQNWRDHDEEIVRRLQAIVTTANPLPDDLAEGIFAAHVVAATTMVALTHNANLPLLFSRMQDLLKRMHDKNPAFGPLPIQHRGDLARDRSYIPQAAEVLAEPAAA